MCSYCSTEEKKGTLLSEKYKEKAYISVGFNSWKKAPKCFEEHQMSGCHKAAVAMKAVAVSCPDIVDLTNKTSGEKKATERHHLMNVIRCVRYLARQGVALQGNPDNDNLFQLLKLLASKDSSIETALAKSTNKYTHNDIQNELLDIMAQHVLRELLVNIRQNGFFSIMGDEYTDIGNKEQLTFCVRSVTDELEIHENFLGFYELSNIKSDTIVHTIQDILLRYNLSLDNCRGQTYDGASNMMGKKSGVATQIKAIQSKAIVTHCHGHSLSLAVKDLTSNCQVLYNTMGTVSEICVLVKFSPKRENILGSIEEVVEGNVEDQEERKNIKLSKLCVTRWTVRASCFNRIIEKYASLQLLWDLSLTERLDTDVKSRIVGVQSQMRSFSFFFGLSLSHKLYSLTDNLSKTLQKEKMSAITGHHLATLTVDTMKGMRNDQDFKLFFESLKQKATKLDVGDPILPRKRHRPNYSALHHAGTSGSEESSSGASYPSSVEAHYRACYFEALDAIIMAINDRFDQPSYQFFASVEQLLLKSIKRQSFDDELASLAAKYSDDLDISALPAELAILHTLCKVTDIVNFDDIVRVLKSSKEDLPLLQNVVTMIKIVLIGGATTATPERSFSLARRIKTFLRSSMTQKRFNSLSILSQYKDLVDNVSLVNIANDFVENKPSRVTHFGKFTDSDL